MDLKEFGQVLNKAAIHIREVGLSKALFVQSIPSKDAAECPKCYVGAFNFIVGGAPDTMNYLEDFQRCYLKATGEQPVTVYIFNDHPDTTAEMVAAHMKATARKAFKAHREQLASA